MLKANRRLSSSFKTCSKKVPADKLPMNTLVSSRQSFGYICSAVLMLTCRSDGTNFLSVT